jgi:hypothetical protein
MSSEPLVFKVSASKNAQNQDTLELIGHVLPILSDLEKTCEYNIWQNAELLKSLGLDSNPLAVKIN